MTTRRGFSLPELLVTLLIVGIVATCAVVAQQAAAQRARRAAASAALLELALRQERHLARHGRYASDPGDLGWQRACGGAIPWPDAARPWYLLRLRAAGSAPGGREYQAVARPAAAQRDDPCGALRIDQLGRRGAERDDCW